MIASIEPWQVDELESIGERVRLIEDASDALVKLLALQPDRAELVAPLAAVIAALASSVRIDLDAQLEYAAR